MNNRKRVNRIFLILGLFVFGILISLALFSDILNTKLETPVFTSFYVFKNPTIPEEEIYPLDAQEGKTLLLGLRFSAWKVTQRDKSKPFSYFFVLYDDKGTAYSFGQKDERMIIQVTKKGSKRTVYYDVLLSSYEFLNRVLVPLNNSETGKAQLKKASFISANIGPDYKIDLLTFGLNTADVETIKANMHWEEWKMINHSLDNLIAYDFMINLDSKQMLKFGQFEKHFYASIHTTIDGVETTNISYDIPQEVYDDVLATLTEYRRKYFEGPSKLVTDSVFTSAYIWIGGGTGMYPAWKFLIKRDVSDKLKSSMGLDMLMRLPKRVELQSKSSCLFDDRGYQYCYGSSENLGYLGYLVVESANDPTFFETYYVPPFSSSYSQTLLDAWGTPVIPKEIKSFNFTQAEIINNLGEVGPSDNDIYNVTSGQRVKIRNLLRFEEWVFDKDPGKYAFGWMNKYAFKTKNGSTIRVFDYQKTTVFWVQYLIPGVDGGEGAWFYADRAVFQQLKAYMTATFPKK